MTAKKTPLVRPGRPYPQGASWDGEGVNFALFSEHAEKVELCLFDSRGRRETDRIELREQTDQVWHAYLPGAQPGCSTLTACSAPTGCSWGTASIPTSCCSIRTPRRSSAGCAAAAPTSPTRSAPSTRICLSTGATTRRDAQMPSHRSSFDWEDDRRPTPPGNDTIIYELHVKGFTRRHPEIAEAIRGTYSGLASAPAIDHLLRLGISAVELMPVHFFVDDSRLLQLGLSNYWGYNSIGFFVPSRATRRPTTPSANSRRWSKRCTAPDSR